MAGQPQRSYYYAGDMHFNPRGYREWARAHIDFLLDPANDLIPFQPLEKSRRSCRRGSLR